MSIIQVLRLLIATLTPTDSWTGVITMYMQHNTFIVAHSSGAKCCPETSYGFQLIGSFNVRTALSTLPHSCKQTPERQPLGSLFTTQDKNRGTMEKTANL